MMGLLFSGTLAAFGLLFNGLGLYAELYQQKPNWQNMNTKAGIVLHITGAVAQITFGLTVGALGLTNPVGFIASAALLTVGLLTPYLGSLLLNRALKSQDQNDSLNDDITLTQRQLMELKQSFSDSLRTTTNDTNTQSTVAQFSHDSPVITPSQQEAETATSQNSKKPFNNHYT